MAVHLPDWQQYVLCGTATRPHCLACMRCSPAHGCSHACCRHPFLNSVCGSRCRYGMEGTKKRGLSPAERKEYLRKFKEGLASATK
jgi:hypothetical protein